MKTTFLTFILISITTLLTAQELPEIPMKNGMAYYKFEHKLDNTTNCLSSYFQIPDKKVSLMTKIVNGNRLFNNKISKDKIGFNVFAVSSKINLKCIDTVTTVSGFSFGTAGGDILWKPIIIEFFSKRVIKSVVKANVIIVFTSKTEFNLIIKDITYTLDYVKGGKSGMDYYNIGELYEQTKASGKITKSDIKFFENLNFFVKSADEINLKALTETYQVDEL